MLQSKQAGLGDFIPNSNAGGVDSARLNPELFNGLGGNLSQLVQGSSFQDFNTGVPHSQQGVSHSQEEAWCSSASSQISLPTMRDTSAAAAQQSPAQMDLQV